jgi:hypothetical protein
MAEFGTYTLGEVAAQVMASDAKHFSRNALPLGKDDEIVRYWEVSNHLRERVRAFLDLYGDGDHYLVATPTVECHAITNPLIDQGVQQTGLFRVARNYEDPQFPGKVFQLLRRGWITALVTNGAVVWDEARAIEGETGSEIVAPPSTNTTLKNRRRVVTVVWNGVAATSARTVAESLAALASNGIGTPTIRGESFGTGWIRLAATHKLAEDGSASVYMVIAQSEACFQFYSAKGLKGEKAETIVHGVPADSVKAYVDGFRKYGTHSTAGTPPRGGSVSGSVDLSSGLASLNFSWKPTDATKGAIITSMWTNANQWEVHFIAWNQPGANLSTYVAANMSGLGLAGQEVSLEAARVALGGAAGWYTCHVSILSTMHAEWSLAGFDYDEETELFSWHSVWRPTPESFIEGQTHYTSKWETRNWFWDDPAAGLKYLTWEQQVCGTQFAHAWDLFSTYEAAWAYRDESQIPDVPFPRLVGTSWLAVKVTVYACTGWVEAANNDGAYNEAGWHGKATDVDYQRYIAEPPA